MGGRSNVSSFGGSNSARHLITHNKHHDGVEAPRNSLDLPLETADRHHVINENLMVKIPSSEMNLHHKGNTPVKLLINEEVSNRENTKRSGPSVVARLMGMDTLPHEKGQTIHAKECFNENPRKHISRVPRFVSAKSELNSFSLTTFAQSKEQLPLIYNKQQYSSSSSKNLNSFKPHRREHPQEELLQKFKKEFESWQASKLWESSSNFDQNDSSQGLKNEPNLAFENLNMEKMSRCINTNRVHVRKKPIETDIYASVNKVKCAPNPADDLYQDANLDKQCVPRMKDDKAIRRKLAANSFEPVPRTLFQEKRSRSCSPTRIVILKPSSDINEIEEPWSGSSEALEKASSMEHFLEEVKERLRLEMEGKGRNDSVRRGNSAHTSLHERSTDPKQLARDIAKHIRESVTRDLGTSSVRSESTRSHRNDFHVNEQESQESIKKDTRKIISDRLKNVLMDDREIEKSKFNGNSLQIKEKERSKSMTDFLKEGKGASFWEDKKAVNESIPKYLRREQMKMAEFDDDAMSPPNLIRSFSAPVSGTAFGKLLLEDQRVATGAQLSRRNETFENDSGRNKKDGLNFKGRVSSLRRNLSFKGKIFGKKMPLIGESTSETFSYLKSIETLPSVIRNYGIVEDNSTEVPPSPASFYSSPTTEHHSPISPLEVPFVEDHSSTQVSGELGTLLDSGIHPEQIESKDSQEVAAEAQLNDTNEIMPIESHAKSYVRDILIVSGLYKAWPLDQALSTLDGQTESISSSVFDQVEEINCKPEKIEANSCKLGDIDMDRKLLFDLVNEALPTVIASPVTPLMSRRWKDSLAQLPCGIKLLDDLFHQIKIYANPKVVQHQSIDKVVSWDVKLRPWFTSSYEDIGYVEKEVEGLIIAELIDELLSDLSCFMVLQ
ncbi:hypothetical protein KFK09_000123 [Dendrobium nobile]|uniref:DUF4378 domain-containing protein n=1 Tax=Dendrobium nobile TaxID=94219 RepID=A0A8T3CD14_DENNO|nr:hypothetical protein KFK09_000123 [Dendrobium nobile]